MSTQRASLPFRDGVAGVLGVSHPAVPERGSQASLPGGMTWAVSPLCWAVLPVGFTPCKVCRAFPMALHCSSLTQLVINTRKMQVSLYTPELEYSRNKSCGTQDSQALMTPGDCLMNQRGATSLEDISYRLQAPPEGTLGSITNIIDTFPDGIIK